MHTADTPATRLSTRLAFLVAGFGYACWAPLVPFAKARLDVDDGVLGLLLLCIGVGSVAAMLAAGPLASRFGSRPVIVAGGFGLALVLPLLAIAPGLAALGLALLLFGAALGSLDVAMNIHAVEVERASGTTMMSGFHALFSIGGFAGATAMTFLLSLGVAPFAGTCACATAMVAAMLVARPRLMRAAGGGAAPLFVRPRGIVLLLAGLAAVTFLVEGAMLDWGALLITGRGLVARAQGGLGYTLFSIAMTAGRLVGDRVTARLGDRLTIQVGGVLAVAGFVVLLALPAPAALAGFLLIGLGASNIVPVLFRRAGAQAAMPPALGIAALTTVGYAGILVGPAAVGFVAKGIGLEHAFWVLAGLMLLVALAGNAATRPGRAG